MNIFEKFSFALRHIVWLEKASWLWDSVRPHYNQVVNLLGKNGLERTINGSDRILILPELREVTETYEPEFWQHLMSQVKQGDKIADIGAYIGVYTIALGQRVGAEGEIFAFEPDPVNFEVLKKHIELNHLKERVNLIQAAVGDLDSTVSFCAGGTSQSAIQHSPSHACQTVQCVRLDTIFSNRHLDILKIDVEGYEEFVLKGASHLLQDKFRCPRLIYIEAHVFAWSKVGTTWKSLLDFLTKCGYQVFKLDGKHVEEINFWGECVAQKK